MSPGFLCFLPPLTRTQPPKSWLLVCSNFRLPAAEACTLFPRARYSSDCLERPYLNVTPVGHRVIHCLLHLVFRSSSYHCLPDRFRPCRCLFHSIAVAPLVRHARGTYRPLSAVVLQLPCVFRLSVSLLIQGLPAMRFDLDHECTRSLLHSFAYSFDNRYHDVSVGVSCERCARAAPNPSRYLVESCFAVALTVGESLLPVAASFLVVVGWCM